MSLMFRKNAAVGMQSSKKKRYLRAFIAQFTANEHFDDVMLCCLVL
jgi:hypothetical protein